jgi:ubiquinone biosynthesis protein
VVGVTSPSPVPVEGDLAVGAFSDAGPWIVEPDAMPWLRGLDPVRTAAHREVAALMGHRGLPPVGRLGRVVVSVGGALSLWWAIDRRRGRTASRRGVSRRLRRSFERLGPTYIKLGQIIASGEGLFPEELVEQFQLLRDRVAPERWDDVRAVVEADLGRPLEEVFSSFARTPIAAASIAQVHEAVLLTGEPVAVKVQRPRVATLVRRDIRALAWLAPHLVGRIPVSALANPPALVELFAETIVEELDFRLEAQNMLDIARVLAETDQRAVIVPRPHPRLVTRRVLVMERLSGFAFHDVAGMHAAGVDTTAVLRAGLIAFMEGAMLHGVFHGDLHPGNLLVQPDGRTVLLDYGITGRLDEHRRLAFLRLLLSGTVGDVRLQLGAMRDLGAFPPDTDLDAVIRELELEGPTKDPTLMSADELVGELRDLTKKLLGYGARMPKELMLFVKNMVFLDGAIATLAPDLDLLEEVQRVHVHFATTHGERIVRELGMAVTATDLDLDAVKASMGVDPSVQTLTYRDVQERREIIRRRMGEARRPDAPRPSRWRRLGRREPRGS